MILMLWRRACLCSRIILKYRFPICHGCIFVYLVRTVYYSFRIKFANFGLLVLPAPLLFFFSRMVATFKLFETHLPVYKIPALSSVPNDIHYFDISNDFAIPDIVKIHTDFDFCITAFMIGRNWKKAPGGKSIIKTPYMKKICTVLTILYFFFH